MKMKNKFFVGVVTFIGTLILIVIFLNIFDSKSKRHFDFKRNFTQMLLLNFEKKYSKMNEAQYLRFVQSDSLIVEYDSKSLDTINRQHRFYFSNLSFTSKSTQDLVLPESSNVIYCNDSLLFYTCKFKLYEYNFKSKVSRDINLGTLNVFSLKLLPDSKDKFICFGENYDSKKYNTGFFIVNFKTSQVFTSQILEKTNHTSMPKNGLVYSGKFNNSFDKQLLFYCCDKYSKIYFFDKNGIFKKELVTNDHTPLPKILTNKKGDTFYGRGGTFTSNMGMFMRDDKIFVFSSRLNDKSDIVIDEYSYSTLEYTRSFKLKFNNLSAQDIGNVIIDKERIILVFEFYYASFIFSRYL